MIMPHCPLMHICMHKAHCDAHDHDHANVGHNHQNEEEASCRRMEEKRRQVDLKL
jgi:hypothetical protein|tara:strand:- start:410 stop:574 length:165 start_codon:yes stop_codon:yes gene_type:complete